MADEFDTSALMAALDATEQTGVPMHLIRQLREMVEDEGRFRDRSPNLAQLLRSSAGETLQERSDRLDREIEQYSRQRAGDVAAWLELPPRIRRGPEGRTCAAYARGSTRFLAEMITLSIELARELGRERAGEPIAPEPDHG